MRLTAFPKLDGRHVLGWVDFCVLLRCYSNNLGRQGIGASVIDRMTGMVRVEPMTFWSYWATLPIELHPSMHYCIL